MVRLELRNLTIRIQTDIQKEKKCKKTQRQLKEGMALVKYHYGADLKRNLLNDILNSESRIKDTEFPEQDEGPNNSHENRDPTCCSYSRCYSDGEGNKSP